MKAIPVVVKPSDQGFQPQMMKELQSQKLKGLQLQMMKGLNLRS